MDYRRIATVTGWLWIATFVTSIPARFIFYAPVLDEPNYVTGAGADAWALVATGAVLELFLIISNVGTAVVPFPILNSPERSRRSRLCHGPRHRVRLHRDWDRQHACDLDRATGCPEWHRRCPGAGTRSGL